MKRKILRSDPVPAGLDHDKTTSDDSSSVSSFNEKDGPTYMTKFIGQYQSSHTALQDEHSVKDLGKYTDQQFDAGKGVDRTNPWRLWWREMVCCITALGALLAIVGTVRTHDSQTIPQWRFGLSLNAIIAAYTIVLKAAAGLVLAEGISHLKWLAVARPQRLSTFAAYDDASRGPLGSLKLLWRNQYRSGRLHAAPFIASLGALITIFVLLLDPFMQQIVRNYPCMKQMSGQYGTVAKTNFYNEVGRRSGAELATIPVPVQRAINKGLFSSEKPIPEFTCTTGNCTFADPYTSVAYCSACLDATDQLQFEQYESSIANLTVPYVNVTLAMEEGNVTLTHEFVSFNQGLIGLISSYKNYELAMIRWDGTSTVPNHTEVIRGYRCKIYPCLKTFQANVTNGRIEEKLIEESGDVFSPTNKGAGSTADLKCAQDTDRREILQQLGYDLNGTSRWLPYNVSLANGTFEQPVFKDTNFQNPCQSDPVYKSRYPDLCKPKGGMSNKSLEAMPARCVYSIGIVTAKSLAANSFGKMFNGEVRNSGWNGIAPSVGGAEGSEALKAIFNAGTGNGTLEDLQGILTDMTDTLSTYMRHAGAEGFSEAVVGKMTYYDTCIEVRWAWLSYAAAVVVLLLIFFAWMVICARNSESQLQGQQLGTPSFHGSKSSALFLLLHGLDRESLGRMENSGVSNKEKQLLDRAKEVTVKFVATDQGWKLSSMNS